MGVCASPPSIAEAPVEPQRTIRNLVTFAGIGLHSGKWAEIICVPAPPDSGIVFLRRDLPDASPVAARLDAVRDVQRGVTIGGAATVRTVEHVLAAVAGLGISNLHVEVKGEELPILDGSAAPYVAALARAGIEEQPAAWLPYALSGPVWVGEGSAWILAIPANRMRITYVVPIDHPRLGTQIVDFKVERRRFIDQIAPARTWGYVEELEALRKAGLAVGASMDNALGIGREGYLSPPRFPDEPARHKVLDLIGDLALLGRPLLAHVIALGAGHALHVALATQVEGTRLPDTSA